MDILDFINLLNDLGAQTREFELSLDLFCNDSNLSDHTKLLQLQGMHSELCEGLKNSWTTPIKQLRLHDTEELRTSLYYHQLHDTVDAYYNSPELARAETLLKNIRNTIIDYHKKGITNANSFRINKQGQSILKTHSEDFKHAWTIYKYKWNNVYRLNKPI